MSAPREGSGISRILQNTSYLLFAQLLAAPLSTLVTAVAARALGASQYGTLFQAMTFASFAFLFVEWGQPNVLTGQVAMDRSRAGELLGSGLVLRVSAGLVVAIVLPPVAWLAGYGSEFALTLLLILCASLLGTVAGACQDVYRGLERLDFAATTMVGWQLLQVAVVVPVLLSGGGLRAFVLAQLACTAVGAAFVLAMAPRLQVRRLTWRRDTMRELVRRGNPFLVFAMVLALQPLIDASFLSKLGTPQEMGWLAAARKLIGVLVFAASALLGALYPALCRLRTESSTAFANTTIDALHVAAAVAVPAALGCALFPGLGIAIFGRAEFGPAEANVRMLAPFLFLVYFSMPVGCCLTAGGRQRGWTLALLGGVVVTAALEPALIGWARDASGNGGFGVCVAVLLGEIATLCFAVPLLPREVLRGFGPRRLLPLVASAAAMLAVALLSSGLPMVVGAALSLAAYAVGMHFTGGLRFATLIAFLRSLRRPSTEGGAPP